MYRCIMIVATKAQLLQAFHIRKKMIGDYPTDIVLLGRQFGNEYINRLEKFYDNVWWIEDDYFSQRDYIKYIFSPVKAIKYKLNSDIDLDYSDVFNWDPGWFFFFFRKMEIKKGLHYFWHMIQDGEGNYAYSSNISYPTIPVTRNIFEKIVYLFDRKVRGVFPLVYDDEFLWKPSIRPIMVDYNVIEVPPIDVNDLDYIEEINYMVGFHHGDNTISDNNIIFLDTYPEYFSEYTVKLVKSIAEIIGPKRVTLFMHPGVEESEYDDIKDYVILKSNYVSWEIICINRLIKNHIIIGVFTSALTMGYITCNDSTEVYSFAGLINADTDPIVGIDSKKIQLWQKLYKNVALYNRHFHYCKEFRELFDIVRNYRNN